jgi:hypothetical protein
LEFCAVVLNVDEDTLAVQPVDRDPASAMLETFRLEPPPKDARR